VNYEAYIFDDRPPPVIINVKLNASGAAVMNFRLKVFNMKTELLQENTTETDSVITELPFGVYLFAIEKPNIKWDPQPKEVKRTTKNITITVSSNVCICLS
jgi:exosome complex RNA-binding protein Rrp42 (RNase PH superfamily)